MENAAEALKMAAWVLIFVVALSIIINAFGMARQTTDILISYNDNEYYTDYVEQGNTERKVGYETIIPAIYRAYKENYKIIFLNNDGTPMYFYDYQEKRKESNDRLIKRKGMIGKVIGFAPMVCLFVGYLIIPLVFIGFTSMSSSFSNMSSGKI